MRPNRELDFALKEAEKLIDEIKFSNDADDSQDMYIKTVKNSMLSNGNLAQKGESFNNNQKKDVIQTNQYSINPKLINDSIILKSEATAKDKNILQTYNTPNFTQNQASRVISEVNLNLFKTYKKQLHLFNFPELGLIQFPSNQDIEQFFKFLDDVIHLKSGNLNDRKGLQASIQNLKYQNDSLQSIVEKLEKDLQIKDSKNKGIVKTLHDAESKSQSVLAKYEKDKEIINSNFRKLEQKYNQLLIEKHQFTDKFNKLSEAFNKLQYSLSKGTKPIQNSFEITENLKRNPILKRLEQTNGAEILVECFKEGYHETLREIIYEVSSLKSFINDINEELLFNIESTSTHISNPENCKLSGRDWAIKQDLLQVPFVDVYLTIKKIMYSNISRLVSIKLNLDESKRVIAGHNILSEESLPELKSIKFADSNIRPSVNHSQFLGSDVDENLIDHENEQYDIQSSNQQSSQKKPKYDIEKTELEHLKNKWIKMLSSAGESSSPN